MYRHASLVLVETGEFHLILPYHTSTGPTTQVILTECGAAAPTPTSAPTSAPPATPAPTNGPGPSPVPPPSPTPGSCSDGVGYCCISPANANGFKCAAEVPINRRLLEEHGLGEGQQEGGRQLQAQAVSDACFAACHAKLASTTPSWKGKGEAAHFFFNVYTNAANQQTW
jgi:hypothetical protein